MQVSKNLALNLLIIFHLVAMNDSGKMFITVGARHVKFWFLESVNQRTTLQVSIFFQSYFHCFDLFSGPKCNFVRSTK